MKTDVMGVLYDNVTMQEALERGAALLEADAPASPVLDAAAEPAPEPKEAL